MMRNHTGWTEERRKANQEGISRTAAALEMKRSARIAELEYALQLLIENRDNQSTDAHWQHAAAVLKGGNQ